MCQDTSADEASRQRKSSLTVLAIVTSESGSIVPKFEFQLGVTESYGERTRANKKKEFWLFRFAFAGYPGIERLVWWLFTACVWLVARCSGAKLAPLIDSSK